MDVKPANLIPSNQCEARRHPRHQCDSGFVIFPDQTRLLASNTDTSRTLPTVTVLPRSRGWLALAPRVLEGHAAHARLIARGLRAPDEDVRRLSPLLTSSAALFREHVKVNFWSISRAGFARRLPLLLTVQALAGIGRHVTR